MRRLLCAAVLLLLPVPAGAAEEDSPRRPHLTPQEIAEGWILLFDGETPFGWNMDATAPVKEGALRLIGGAKGMVATCTTAWDSFEHVRLE